MKPSRDRHRLATAITDLRPNPWQIDIREPVPPVIALQVGEIAHSLRSALDVMLCDIAAVRNVGMSNMHYPFAENETAFRQKLSQPNRDQPFKKLGADVVSLIEASRPYCGGDDLLRGLHDLNIQDKHRLSIPVASITHVTANTPEHHFDAMVEEGDVQSWHGNFPLNLKVSWPIPEDFFHGDPSETFQLHEGTVDLLFAEGTVFGNRNVAHTMQSIVNLVSGLVERFRMAVMG